MTVLTPERFLRDIAGHQMMVVRDDGIYRHVRFKKPDTICLHFDLITWPGYLCYTGDMGTYVFTRLRDMFDFFRRSKSKDLFAVDHHYWAEKVEAGGRAGRGNGVTQFSKAKFDAAVRQRVEDFVEGEAGEATDLGETELFTCALGDLRAAVERDVIGADDNDIRCFDAANEFVFGAEDSESWGAYFGAETTFEFTDFWEVNHDEFTHRFQWCCYALAWGIRQYDESKAAAGAAEGEEVPA
ncbi:hypothetical protein [Massilia timonae]|uniref:hypothetical protein n=1 Tax=Massilia timonae TaxID=47229 RepID=UPI0028D4A6C0|nr:hypothetical protein [Massilia timonae]